MPTAEFAELWWEIHRLKISPSGEIVLGTLDGDAGYDQDEEDLEDWADAYLGDLSTLGRFLRVLAESAPTEYDLRFVGTTILEDAYQVLGDDALRALDESGLPESVRQTILSGFRR